MVNADGVLGNLLQGTPIAAPVAVVVAHPDDETIGAGASLALLNDLVMVHVTDGAPRNRSYAQAAGFGTAVDYAAARRMELLAAMRIAGAIPRIVSLPVPDQEASLRLPYLVEKLGGILSDVQVVITHAYEGGHPDHDACAAAVHRACQQLARAPLVLEFPCYRAGPNGTWLIQEFLPNGPAAATLQLGDAARARKRAALDCFVSQRHTLAQFSPGRELFRPAPHYDFRRPPHSGKLLYEERDWGMTGDRWRALNG